MIVGLTGTNGAGKTVTADHLKAKGFRFYSLSDEIRAELERQRLSNTRENLIEMGNRLRREYGPPVLAERVKTKLRPDQNYVIDSIRNPSEVEALRLNGNFHLLHLDAPPNVRYERVVSRGGPCVACSHVDQLDLKTVMHSGRLLLYDLRGQQELSGLSVIVAHRLLKNSLGLPRYLLITEVAHEQIALSLEASPTRHVELYEGIGEVAAYVYRYEPETLLADETPPTQAGLSTKVGEAARKLRENLRTLTT